MDPEILLMKSIKWPQKVLPRNEEPEYKSKKLSSPQKLTHR